MHLEVAGNRVLAFRSHLIGKSDVDNPVDIRLRDVLWEHRRDMVRKRRPLPWTRILFGFAEQFEDPLVVRLLVGGGLRFEFKQAVDMLARQSVLFRMLEQGVEAFVLR